MSCFDDDLDEMGAAAGLHGDGSIAGDSRGSGQFADPSPLVAQFLRELGALGDGPPPAPSAELAAVFDGTASLSAARRRRSTLRTHRVGVAIAAAAISTAALTGVAAANERLPQPAQTVVARVVNDLTPFHVDPSHLPAAHHPKRPPAPRTTAVSRPTETEPTEIETTGPQPGQPGPTSPAPAEQSEPGDSQATGGSATAGDAPGAEDRTGPTSAGRRSSAADPTSDGAGDGAGD